VTHGEGGAGRTLRILVVNWLDRENPKAGGAEEHLHEVFGRLAGRGHDVTALVSGWSGCTPRASLDGIDVHRAGSRYTFSVAGPRYFSKRLREKAYDVVVEDLNKVPLFAPRWTHAPVVLLVHHLFGSTAFQAAPVPVAVATVLLERTIPLFYRRLPAVAVSESTREDLVRRGLASDRVAVIPNGIDVDHFTPTGAPRRTRPTLLFVGRLQPYKRVDLLLEAVARLVRDDLDVELLVAGSGDQVRELQELAESADLSHHVRFLGFVSEEEKLDLLRSAWIHVLTSPKEGWGITCLEAAACGTPTVASDAPGLRESVVDGETGLLVPHGDVGALADAIRSLIDDPDRRRVMGEKARRFAEGYTWEAATDAFERLLQQVVRESRHV